VLAWWPVVPLVWGTMLVTGLGTCRRRPLGAIWLVVGVAGLLEKLHLWNFTFGDLFPLFLVFVGGTLIVRAWRGAGLERAGDAGPVSRATEMSGARVNLFSLLGGMRRTVNAQAFVGGEVTALMSGLTVDLRGAQLADGHAVLDVFAMWGGIEVLAPAGWRVISRVTPLLGAVVDAMPEPAGADAPTLELRGLAVMGGLDVRADDRVRQKIRRVIVATRIGSDDKEG